MRKQKVVHIITKLDMGGAQENTIYTFLNHNRNKYEVYLITGGDYGCAAHEYISRIEDYGNFCIVKDLSNELNPIKALRAFWGIYSFIKKNHIDIVHTHSSTAGVLGRAAAKAAGVCVIVHTVHGWSFNDAMGKFKRQMYILLERFAARLCDRMITVTKLDITKGLKSGISCSSKYVTIRSGIDFKRFESFDEEKAAGIKAAYQNKKLIGTIGRISEQKNLTDFVRIAEKLTGKRDDIKFIIVGDGPKRKELEVFIKKTGMEPHVELLGARADVNDLLHSFDMFLLTSLWEGLPRVIPEAMFCGVPVVANSVDGVPEIIENGVNGFTTEPHDLETACCRIEELLDNREVREAIIKNAKSTACPEYGAELMVQQIEMLYDGIFLEKSS